MMDANKESAEQNLKDAEQAVGRGDYISALDELDTVEHLSKLAGIPVPKKVAELKKKACKLHAETNFKYAEQAVGRGEYLPALAEIDTVERLSRLAGIPVPGNVAELKKTAYKLGAEQKLEDAEKAVGLEEYVWALAELDLVETYSRWAGIPVPGNVAELKKTAYKLGAEQKLEDAEQAIGLGDYCRAINGLQVVERYSGLAGMQVPGKVAELRNQIKELRYKES